MIANNIIMIIIVMINFHHNAQGQWVAAACSKELVLNGASHWDKPLWRLVLEVPPASGSKARLFETEMQPTAGAPAVLEVPPRGQGRRRNSGTQQQATATDAAAPTSRATANPPFAAETRMRGLGGGGWG